MRADLFLSANGYCKSRSRAARSIEGGCVFVNGKRITKPSFDIKDTDTIEVRGQAIPDVSRGGLKLRGALDTFDVKCDGLVCVDIGASTGGFTDVLLKNGAKKVFAVDCGVGQLHPSLVTDGRVVNLENFNARTLTKETLGQAVDMAVMDVSFISQALLHPVVAGVLNDGGIFISLIKPQFEVGRRALTKSGIVKDAREHIGAIETVISSAKASSLVLNALTVSPISGGDGNREFLALFIKNGENEFSPTKDFLKALTQA